jgi:5S rRNA maturation endonuclease (ribonuclease M5)
MAMLDLRSLARALGGEVSKGQVLCPGPGHSRKDRSLSVKIDASAPDGFVCHSFAGDDPIECKDFIRMKCGLPIFTPHKSNGGGEKRFTFSKKATPTASTKAVRAEALATEATAPKDKKIVATYDYTDNGALLYQVVRYDPKDFRQRRPDGNGGWIWSVKNCRRVLYRLADLLKHPDATVFVCEGEKDADRVASLGHCAVTVACGDWTKDCIEALAGHDVIILEDADKPGVKKAHKAAALLHGTAKTVRIVRLPGQEYTAERGGKDVSDWLDADPVNADKLVEVCFAAPLWTPEVETATGEAPTTKVTDLPLSIHVWLKRDLPAPDYLIGNWLTTTSRILFAADTGLGKTNFMLAAFSYLAAGRDFLHWSIPQPRRVLYVDGEMSRRLLLQRLEDAVRRLGVAPDTLHALSHEDVEGFQPLNTEAGQKYIFDVIEQVGADAVCFDNIMALIAGDMKDEDAWRATLPLIKTLTKQNIGQVWVHHTGHDTSHGYGTKTREWETDTVMHGTAAARSDTDVSFLLEFRKARERTPANRHDFAEVTVALVNDQWISDAVVKAAKPKKVSPVGMKFFEALQTAFADNETTTFQSWKAVTMLQWRAECGTRGLIDEEKPHIARSMLSKYRQELIAANLIACNNDLVWIVRP